MLLAPLAQVYLVIALAALVRAGESSSPRFRNQSEPLGTPVKRVAAAPGTRFSSTLRAPPRRAAPTSQRVAQTTDTPTPVSASWPNERTFPLRPGAAAAGGLALLAALTVFLRRRRGANAELAILAHELKSPLTAMESYLDLMEHEGASRKSPDATRWTSDIKRMKAAAGHLRQTVGDVMDLAALEGGRLSLSRSACDLAALGREVVESMAEVARAKELRIETNGLDAPVKASADPVKLRRVLYNLIDNAIKYTRERGQVTLRLSRGTDPKTAVFSVEDTGVGIASSDLKRLFGKFVRLKSSIGAPGSGLGLFISKAIVEAHGGKLWAESRPGRGSIFRFTLKEIQA